MWISSDPCNSLPSSLKCSGTTTQAGISRPETFFSISNSSVVVSVVSLRCALIWHIPQCYSTAVTFQRFPVPWKVDSLSGKRLRGTHRCRFILSINGSSAEPRQTCLFDLEGGRVCVKNDSHTNLPLWPAWRFSLQVVWALICISGAEYVLIYLAVSRLCGKVGTTVRCKFWY